MTQAMGVSGTDGAAGGIGAGGDLSLAGVRTVDEAGTGAGAGVAEWPWATR